MRETSNYKLSQWEKTDRIEMEDFNSDNQKIDSQLHAAMQQLAQAASQEGLAAEQAAREAGDSAEAAARTAGDNALRNENCWVKLKEVTTGAVSSVNIDTSDIDWSQYRKAEIILVTSSTSSSAVISMRINGQTDSIYYSNGTTAVSALRVSARHSSGGISTVSLAEMPNSGGIYGHVLASGKDGSFYEESHGVYVPGIQLQLVRSLQFFFSGSCLFTAGSQIALYGLKK